MLQHEKKPGNVAISLQVPGALRALCRPKKKTLRNLPEFQEKYPHWEVYFLLFSLKIHNFQNMMIGKNRMIFFDNNNLDSSGMISG